jgi:hypothetical protein
MQQGMRDAGLLTIREFRGAFYHQPVVLAVNPVDGSANCASSMAPFLKWFDKVLRCHLRQGCVVTAA